VIGAEVAVITALGAAEDGVGVGITAAAKVSTASGIKKNII